MADCKPLNTIDAFEFHQRAKDIFLDALDVEAADREPLLEKSCENDAQLLHQVRELLSSHDNQQHSVLSIDFGKLVANEWVIEGTRGDYSESNKVIGRFEIIDELGRGGFGVVHRARQTEPISRDVAIKVLRAGVDSKELLARFRTERQAIALMDHPNIARVLDAGVADDSRPFLVMELVEGIRITNFCDYHDLSIAARLAIFVNVCHGIQHAHQKGIIHRDIKPSNILVAFKDGTPIPKVIDFGIAKVIVGDLRTIDSITMQGEILGSPVYMSPEQSQQTGNDTDTRSDIYSLGVLLYELLTGATPLRKEELTSKSLMEILTVIRDFDPDVPSARISSLSQSGDDTALKIAEARQTIPRKLQSALLGDLDWIVMRCLEKDRERRYGTVADLIADIHRHLTNQPVEAGPPAATYRLKKFIKRNQTWVLVGCLAASALILGMAGTSAGMAWALSQKARAESAEQTAQRELIRASEVKLLLKQMLSEVAPNQAKGMDTTLLRNILDSAANRLKDGTVQDKLVEAELRMVVGQTYFLMSLYDKAEQHLPIAYNIHMRLLGKTHAITLNSAVSLGQLRTKQARFDEAESVCRGTLEAQRVILGDEHPNTLLNMNNLAIVYRKKADYEKAEPLHVEAYETRKRLLGNDHPDTLASMNSLGLLYEAVGRYDDAQRLYTAALEGKRRTLGNDHPHTMNSINNLANLHYSEGQFKKSEPLYEEAFELRKRVLGADHIHTLSSVNNLGGLYLAQGRFEDAASQYLTALDGRQRVLGPDHPHTLNSLKNLGSALIQTGELEQAQVHLETALKTETNVLGRSHPNTQLTMLLLGDVLLDLEEYESAESVYLEAMSASQDTMGEEHASTMRIASRLGIVYTKQNRFKRAEAVLLKNLNTQKRVLRKDHTDVLSSMISVAALYLEPGQHATMSDFETAERWARHVCETAEAEGSLHWSMLDTLAAANFAIGDHAAAVEIQKRTLRTTPSHMLAEGREKLRKYSEAAVAASGDE